MPTITTPINAIDRDSETPDINGYVQTGSIYTEQGRKGWDIWQALSKRVRQWRITGTINYVYTDPITPSYTESGTVTLNHLLGDLFPPSFTDELDLATRELPFTGGFTAGDVVLSNEITENETQDCFWADSTATYGGTHASVGFHWASLDDNKPSLNAFGEGRVAIQLQITVNPLDGLSTGVDGIGFTIATNHISALEEPVTALVVSVPDWLTDGVNSLTWPMFLFSTEHFTMSGELLMVPERSLLYDGIWNHDGTTNRSPLN